jgi:hypothetical protein
MSDQEQARVSGQADGTAGSPASAPGQSQPAAASQQPEQASQHETEAKPVTAQDLRDMEERVTRQIQSTVDKRDANVRKRLDQIDAAVKTMREGGQEISDEAVQAMKEKAAAKALTDPIQEPAQPEPADRLDSRGWKQDDPLAKFVMRQQAKMGTTITAEDPEAANIDYSSPEAWADSQQEALKKKAARLQSEKQTPTEEVQPSNPAARIPAQGGHGEAPAKSARNLWKDAYGG